MEADLDRFYNRDIRDLWRFDRHGRRRLTLRMVYVRIIHLPAESALAIDATGGRVPWSLTDHLVADLWTLTARQGMGKKAPRELDHPRRPKGSPRPVTPERAARLQAAKRRRAAIARRRRKEE
ncbi:hypothetical protein [Nocardia salmonicida]|uniref:hypothetical protein n=1 Tax=Nocardia salmonicida TaxID=53431 RepID=UPI002E2A9DD9|nr:hypothetical protein [Nocardia salmonicida]